MIQSSKQSNDRDDNNEQRPTKEMSGCARFSVDGAFLFESNGSFRGEFVVIGTNRPTFNRVLFRRRMDG